MSTSSGYPRHPKHRRKSPGKTMLAKWLAKRQAPKKRRLR